MNRHYVHLTTDWEYATSIGRWPKVILRVAAAMAYIGGIRFYPASGTVWLAEFVPAEFLCPISNAQQEQFKSAIRQFLGDGPHSHRAE